MVAYEARLSGDVGWALREGSMHFEEESAVHTTLRRITRRLDELGIPYALADAMALFFHGYRRFTEDVDLLVTRQGLEEIHRQLEGLGYVPPYPRGEALAGRGVRRLGKGDGAKWASGANRSRRRSCSRGCSTTGSSRRITC